MALTAFVTGFVLTVVDGPMQRVRLRLNAGKKQFIFSACNEKSLSIAASIPRQKKENIIFIVQDNLDTRIKDRMKEMGAVYVKLSLENVVEKLNGKAKKMELFLFGENEKENLDRLEEELDWFIKKFDYRYREEPWKTSKDALPRTILKINGHWM